jgi:hypothetical protein
VDRFIVARYGREERTEQNREGRGREGGGERPGSKEAAEVVLEREAKGGDPGVLEEREAGEAGGRRQGLILEREDPGVLKIERQEGRRRKPHGVREIMKKRIMGDEILFNSKSYMLGDRGIKKKIKI